jgi:hypothetical protein
MTTEQMIAAAKARREAQGLKVTITNLEGRTFDSFPSTAAQRADLIARATAKGYTVAAQ